VLQIQRVAERIFVCITLLLYTGGIAPFIADTNPLYPITQFLPYLALTITLFLIAARRQRVFSIAVRDPLLWLVILINGVSFLWSDYPSETLEKVMPLLRVSVFGMYLAGCYTLRQQLKIFTVVFGMAGCLSLITSILLPQYSVVGYGYISGMEDVVHNGAWRGIFVHRTALASMAACSTLLFCLALLQQSRYLWLLLSGLILFIGLILQSSAKGALLVLIVTVMLIPIYQALRLSENLIIPLLAVLCLAIGTVVIIFIANLEPILTGLGKDITISGRTEFWPHLIDKIRERPWLGYGYHTFWVNGWKGEAADIWRYLKYGFEPPHAHNAVLEILLNTGLIGLIISGLHYVLTTIRALMWVRQIRTVEGLIPLIYLTFTFLINLTESYFLLGDIFWLLYISFALSMHQRSIHIWESDSIWPTIPHRASRCLLP
jgi:O-antigen ligase